MILRKFAAAGLLALAALFAGGATGTTTGIGNGTVTRTANGYRIGNPAAKITLIEWVSYTCPHCGHFAKEADAPLQILYVSSGRVNREIRHIVRDQFDLTAAMLADCGPVEKFPQNHTTLMLSQKDWLTKAENSTPAQRQRWSTGTYAARRRAIASDLGFYEIMRTRGYRRFDLDACLSDDAKAKALADNTQKQYDDFHVTGTPSFAINGVLLAGTHDWSLLQPQIDARLP